MTGTQNSQSEENKHWHLLQPIRDLTANWDINLASELEEYLEALSGITISFDGGLAVNFAEAALVIQGSACVYSKKVEHLHTLVYQALEFIANQKRRGEQKSGNRSAHDEDLQDFDDEEQFLSLDDVLTEGKDIDLQGGTEGSLRHFARPPDALLALEGEGDTRGEGEASYKLAQCFIHSSGALLLESRDGELLNSRLEPCSSSGRAQAGQELGSRPLDPLGTQMEYRPVLEPAQGRAEDTGRGYDSDGGGDDPGWMGDEGGGGWDDDDEPDPAAGDGAVGRVRFVQQPRPPPAPKPEPLDPYIPLDPHSAGNLPIKKFRKGRCQLPKAKATPAQEDESGMLWRVPPAALKGMTFAEFDYALRALEAAEKLQNQASRHRLKKWAARGQVAQELLMPEEDVDAAERLNDADFDSASDDGNADFGPCDDGAGFDNDDFNLGDSAEFLPGADSVAGQTGLDCTKDEAMTYEELCRAHVEAFVRAAAAAEVHTELTRRVLGWQVKIQPMLDEQVAAGEFDIHKVGDKLLDRIVVRSIGDTGEPPTPGAVAQAPPVPFAEVVCDSQRYNVSRTFSAMLQLINNGNVLIQRGERPEDPFALKLSKLEKHENVFNGAVLIHTANMQEQLQPNLQEVDERASRKQPTKKRKTAR